MVDVPSQVHLAQAQEVGKKLMQSLALRVGRKEFFSSLSRLLQEHFHFDRLCINLYDQQGEMLTYFTAAEGTLVSTLSPVRPAEPSTTVAGHVIVTRKPVVITDFAQYFSESSVHPIAEAGLHATMAFPLILNDEIIATLHCSFAEQPDNLYDITSFMVELCPAVAACLGAVLTLEQRSGEATLPVQPLGLAETDADIICHSKPMREVMRRVNAAAKLNIPILLLGETGTGKSLMAQYIHRRSPRRDAHFIKVNCPSLSNSLFESEIFGHAKGAFTGAAGKRIGRFELAHEGTLFLDEIGELSLEMQSKLLQVLEDSSFERVGESVALAVDVRVVAATNINIAETLGQGKLRSDLFYRLAACSVELPPLRERREDIPPLITALFAQNAKRLGIAPVKPGRELMTPLLQYSWPGNVRELGNVITRLLIQAGISGKLEKQDIEAAIEDSARLISVGAKGIDKKRPSTGSPGVEKFAGGTLADAERRHIVQTLHNTGGVIAGPDGAAARLGVPRSTLQHRMHKLGIPAHPGRVQED